MSFIFINEYCDYATSISNGEAYPTTTYFKNGVFAMEIVKTPMMRGQSLVGEISDRRYILDDNRVLPFEEHCYTLWVYRKNIGPYFKHLYGLDSNRYFFDKLILKGISFTYSFNDKSIERLIKTCLP